MTMTVDSVGRDEGGVILWIADEDGRLYQVRLADARAFELVGEIMRAIQFPRGQ